MNRPSLFITLLIGVLAILLWTLLNIPEAEPPWPTQITGFSFSPMRGDQTPTEGRYPSVAQIDEDLALLAGDAHAIRTYSVTSNLAEIPRLASAHSLNVALGAWITGDAAANDREIEKLISVYRENYRSVVRVIVGNEALLHGVQTPEQMIKYLQRVREKVWAPVSLAEPWHIWLQHPELVEQVDYIAVHLLPYWEGIPVDQAVDYVVMRYRELQEAYPDKPIVIGEVGWPSNGRTRQGAVPSQANQARFLRRFLSVAEQYDYNYYIIEAFDQIWKRELEGEAGTYWGVYNDQREQKFAFTAPVIQIPQWQELAAIAIALSVMLLVLLFRDSSGLKHRGRGFLALIVYSIATFVVWMVYDFSHQYMTAGTLVVGVLLLLAAIGVVVVLLAEAHEWAEALWIKEWRRTPEAQRPLAGKAAPMVSIHLPAYNEPPEMMIQTLDALAALDYPRFEVLVIDNNTKEPAVWQPVRDHCQALGTRFRFFHVDPLDGFKSGALNFALRETAAEAEIVAVIDSDYMVDPGWLREMVPLFDQPNMAIVQSPQDYRDGNESAFKAMCMAEYRGFFHIGMVTRNERNAIIQHGTMTLVRRRVLEEVEGWSEWCITEDAELGLRIFERGYDAIYVPQSYGKGLMPDTFLDFKKQRFRWAYGAVLILRRHLWELLGLRRTLLTVGQRYHFIAGWLPWFADGFNLLFNLGALSWSLAMICYPEHLTPPHILFAVLPLTLFLFKILKMFFLYRRKVAATLRQSLTAGLTGLALSHTIARAMMTGFLTRSIGFFRTPKKAKCNALFRALMEAREELLFMTALALAAVAIQQRPDGEMLDTRIWTLVLYMQMIPYLASTLLSLISGLPKLPARLVGVMGPLQRTLPQLDGKS